MNIFRRRMPTILGFLILIGGIVGGVILIQKGGVWFLRAEPEEVPKQIRITNISENSFTVSWTTDEAVIGFVKYGLTPSLEETVSDERDELSGKPTAYLVHHVKVEESKPGVKYYFKIGSGKKLFDNNGKPYEVTTAPVLETPPPADTVYGTILKPDGAAAEGVVVYLSLANSTPLSALTKSGGNWAVPLSVARTSDLSSYLIYDPQASVEEISVQGGDLGTATAIVTTRNDSPVPVITLGQSYDFRETDAGGEPEAEPTTTPPASKFPLQPLTTPPPVEEELAITNPDENEGIKTQKPEIQGKGPSGKTIKVTLESPATFTSWVTINEDGSWNWTPPSELSLGEHTITAILEDGTTVSRRFTVLAAEAEFPAFTATPSGTITPSPLPTPSPTASPTPTPTPVTRTGVLDTEEGVPEPGYLTPTMAFVILGTVLILTGLFLNFKLSF